MVSFLIIMLGFGCGLISSIYMLQHFFKDQNSAIRGIIPLLLFAGTIVPLIATIVTNVVGANSEVPQQEEQQGDFNDEMSKKLDVGGEGIGYYLVMINPLMTFYIANF